MTRCMAIPTMQAPVKSVAELRAAGWRFVEVVLPVGDESMPAFRALRPADLGRWLALPPDLASYPERAERFGTRPAALRWAAMIEASAATLADFGYRCGSA